MSAFRPKNPILFYLVVLYSKAKDAQWANLEKNFNIKRLSSFLVLEDLVQIKVYGNTYN